MFRFFRNLFKDKNKKKIYVEGMEIVINKKKGEMKITSDYSLSEERIRELFEKYVLGED